MGTWSDSSASVSMESYIIQDISKDMYIYEEKRTSPESAMMIASLGLSPEPVDVFSGGIIRSIYKLVLTRQHNKPMAVTTSIPLQGKRELCQRSFLRLKTDDPYSTTLPNTTCRPSSQLVTTVQIN